MIATLLSLLGLVPFIICGLGALGPDPERAGRLLYALIGWAALILAFAGGMQWGFALRSTQAETRHAKIWMALAVVCLLAGWIAVVLPSVTMEWLSLVLLIAAYAATLGFEHRAATLSVLPPRYVLLRWSFTVVAVAMLTTVLTLRLLGQTIAF